MNLSQFERFFKEMDTYSLNEYQLVLLQLCLTKTVILEGFNFNITWKSLNNRNMGWGWGVGWGGGLGVTTAALYHTYTLQTRKHWVGWGVGWGWGWGWGGVGGWGGGWGGGYHWNQIVRLSVYPSVCLMEVALSPHIIMLFMLQLAISIIIFCDGLIDDVRWTLEMNK